MATSSPVEDRLLHTGLVRPGQIAEARSRAAQSGKSTWAELVRLRILTEEEVGRFFGQELDVPFVNPSDYQLDPQLALQVGEELARTHLLVPLFVVEQIAFVAMANPTDVAALDEVHRRTGLIAEPLIATTAAIHHILDDLYGIEDRCGAALQYAEPQRVRGIGPQETREHLRMRVELNVQISLVTSSIKLRQSQSLTCSTEDLSLGGARVLLPVYLPRGTEVLVAVPVRVESRGGAQDALALRARITHCSSEGLREPLVRAGIQFLHVGPEARVLLQHLLSYPSV